MNCAYCVHVENCISLGKIMVEEIDEGLGCNDFEYGGLFEPDKEAKND